MKRQTKPQSAFSKESLAATMSLSRLKLSVADKAALAKDLPAIAAFVGQLKAISGRESSATEPAAAAVITRFRSDSAKPDRWPLAKPEDLIAASPAHRDGFIVVPHVFSS